MAKDNHDKPKRAKLYLPQDLADALAALGGDWEAKAVAALRALVDKPGKGKVRDFIEDVAGPYLPQLETVAREVASKVAKDVATAAAAAAMAAWATKKDDTPAAGPARKPAGAKKA